MVILTTTYNCEKYIDKCLESIKLQTFDDFTCYITDDMSTDNTINRINDIIKNDNRFKLIINTEKKYQPGNYDQIIIGENIGENEICVEVDGDDWLYDRFVFNRINNVYKNKKTWIANGSFVYNNGVFGFSKKQENISNIRKEVFTASHIRTWKAFLWQNIEENDLKDENGDYWSVAGDLSFMFPMLEMSGDKHYTFMPEINYVYNDMNPLNDHKVNLIKVNETINKIRNKKPYNKL